MNNILITTTVSLDVNVQQPMMVIHLMQGNYGTRALRLVPVENGRLMDLSQVAAASVGMSCVGHDNLEIDCEISDTYVTLVPTKAMTQEADEWLCQLNLMNEDMLTLSSALFRVIVHGTAYDGDAVEHTNTGVTAVYFEDDGRLTIEKLDGEKVTSPTHWEHDHPVATAEAPGFMTAEMAAAIEDLSENVNQGVKTTDQPTFAGLKIGNVTIDANGTISGAVFT